MQKIFVLILCICSFMACTQNESKLEKFSLAGSTHSIADGTLIYLEDNITNKIIDSTIISQDSFYFCTPLKNFPKQIFLYSKDYSLRKTIWVEDKAMLFDGSKNGFNHATITGSVTDSLNQLLKQELKTVLEENRENSIQEFVKNYNNSRLSVFLLSIYSTTWGKEKTQELFNLLSEKNKISEYGQEVKMFLKLNKNPQICDKFIDFELENIEGAKGKLSDTKKKLILLEFWSSWCAPCVEQNKQLAKMYQRYKKESFEIVAVSIDTEKEDWLQAIKDNNLNWLHLCDFENRKNKASLIYGINSIPDNFLIDSTGVIMARNLKGDTLESEIKEYFGL